MQVISQTGGTSTVSLTRAILIYKHEQAQREHLSSRSQTIATVHPVTNGVIGAGAAASTDAVRDLAIELLSMSGGMQLVEPNVIATGIDSMAWHVPPKQQRMWFAPHDGSSPVEKKQHAVLRKLSGEEFPQPHLLFIATPNTFRVFALACKGRPTGKTQLYRAPYWNVNSEGVLCIGSTRFPKTISPSKIPQFEAAFFKSQFTHSTLHGAKDVKGGHNTLWASLVNRSRFPSSRLMRIPKLTIASAIRHEEAD